MEPQEDEGRSLASLLKECERQLGHISAYLPEARPESALQKASLPAQCDHRGLPPAGVPDLPRGHGALQFGAERRGAADGRRELCGGLLFVRP